MKFKPKGIIAAMATPMYADESICLPELEHQTDRLIDNGIHGLFCLGTNGEFYTLTTEEKLTIIKTVVTRAAGRCRSMPVQAA